MSTRRYALALLLLPSLCLAYACKDQITNTDYASLAVTIVMNPEAQAANVDQGMVRLRGPASRDVSISPGSETTIGNLQPGTYTVALEGMESGEVAVFAENPNVRVNAGQTTTISLTPQSFVPTLQTLPSVVGVGEEFQVHFSSVAGATGYTVEVGLDPGFLNRHVYETPSSPATVFLDGVGDSYIRVRANNNYPSTGLPSPSATVVAEPSGSVCSVQSEIPASDCEILVALYESTDGTAWINDENWLATTQPCSWYGVGCSDGSLTSLNLPSNGLNGNLPSSLGSLSAATYLRFLDNQLSGSIPSELANLSTLEYLELSANQLTGSIPSSLGSLPALQELYLDRNQLTGTIPPELGSIGELVALFLAQNQLDGGIPAELGNLANLKVLRLDQNQLTGGIPTELTNLTSLEEVSFWNNVLSGSIPNGLDNLQNLQLLSLSHNDLTGEIPADLGNLTNLRALYLNSNQLSGDIPPELGNLASLEDLYLRYNNLGGGIPPQLGNLTNLRRLYLQVNGLSGTIPLELANLSNLEHLDVGQNQLTGSLPPELGSMPNLVRLDFAQNQLSGTIPTELGNLSNLQYLLLWENELTGTIPPGLGNLSNLVYLDLDSNQLTGGVPAELGGLPNLTWFKLFGNQLSGLLPLEVAQNGGLVQNGSGTDRCQLVPPGNEGLYMNDTPEYRAADLDGDGRICGLGFVPAVCQSQSEIPEDQCAALAALYQDTDGPNWTNNTGWLANETPCSWFGVSCSGGSVTHISLPSNQLNGPLPHELGNLPALEGLILFDNQLNGELPLTLGGLSSVTRINVNSNQLEGPIPSALGNLANLQDLWLYGNLLTGPIPRELGSLHNLLGLGLHRNELTGSIPAELGDLTNLQFLDLSGNQLSDLVPRAVAQNGGRIQNQYGASECTFTPPGNEGLLMYDTGEYRAADLDTDGRICGVVLSGSPPGSFYEDFEDGDYTANPAWELYGPGGGFRSVGVVSGELQVKRSNAGGEGRWTRLETQIDIGVVGRTQIQSDVKVVGSSVVGGCGSACTEFPVNVVVHVEAADGRTHSIYYAYNDDGGYSQILSGPTHVNHYVARGDAPTGVWLRQERHRIQDVVPDATRIHQMWIGGVGWDYDGWYDNIEISDDFPPDPSHKLVAHYPLDGDGEDVSGYSHHATVYGAVPAPDRFGTAGTALNFDGVDDYLFIAEPVPSSLDVTKPTITAWVKLDRTDPSSLFKVVNRQEAQASLQGYGLLVRNGLPALNSSTGADVGLVDGPSALQAGQWYFLAGTNDGTTLRIYLNGDLVNTEPSPGAQYGPIDGPFAIGRAWRDAWHVPGTIDDVRIYNRVLSASEIADLCDVASVCGGTP